MPPLDPEQNRLYTRVEDLHPSHWERLERRDPAEAARAAGALWDGRAFHLRIAGTAVRVVPRTRQVVHASDPSRSVRYQQALVSVAYLGRAVEVPPAGLWVRFRDLPGGDAFFRGLHAVDTPRLAAAFGRRPQALLKAAERLGGRKAQGGDVAAELPALPRVPVRAIVGAGDEEFEPTATLLTDARAHMHLPLDGLWALSNLVVAGLIREAA